MKKVTFLIVLLASLSSWYGTAQSASYPYSEDFEANGGSWATTNRSNGTWALEIPSADTINRAESLAVCNADTVVLNNISTIKTEEVELENCIIPQGISPNDDGFNDTLDLSNCDVVRIEIFNRLGKMVFSKDNYTNEWRGQSNNGDELPVGTYFYTIVYEGGASQVSSWIYINK